MTDSARRTLVVDTDATELMARVIYSECGLRGMREQDMLLPTAIVHTLLNKYLKRGLTIATGPMRVGRSQLLNKWASTARPTRAALLDPRPRARFGTVGAYNRAVFEACHAVAAAAIGDWVENGPLVSSTDFLEPRAFGSDLRQAAKAGHNRQRSALVLECGDWLFFKD